MFVVSRGNKIHYEAEGSGPGLVLIPGLFLNSRYWMDAGYFDAFRQDYRTIAIDPLGQGASDRPHEAGHYRGEGLCEDIQAVLDAEGLEDAHLWGYSGGALVAIGTAVLAPERVRSIILGGQPPNLPMEFRPAVFQPWIDALRAQDWEGFWSVFLPTPRAAQLQMEADNDPLAAAAAIEGMLPFEIDLGSLRAPTLSYMGSKEVFLDTVRENAEEAGAAFHVIEDRGHVGAFQDLAAVGPIVRAHLEAVDAAGEDG